MSDVLVLCYHAVSEDWTTDLSVTPRDLERQLTSLVDRGYRGATFNRAVTAPPGGRTVAVTFDDAYRSVFELARPILNRLGLPGTVFVPTGFAGAERPMAWPGISEWAGSRHEAELIPMSWAQLRTLTADGWEIGSHSRTHPRLTALDGESLRTELEGSRADCESRLGQRCASLAYPYGEYNAAVVDAAGRAGYSAAGAMAKGRVSPAPLHWPRVGVYHDDADRRFRIKVSAPVRRLRRSSLWALRRQLAGVLR